LIIITTHFKQRIQSRHQKKVKYLNHSGDYMVRNVILEVDKFQGTEFPPEKINIEAKEFNFETIFLDADLKIEVRPGETDIVDLGGGDGAYSIGELDNLMQNHRSGSDNVDNMSAYLVIVNGIYFDEEANLPGPDPSVLGIMFDSKLRLGTAVFYGVDMVRSDELAFFRTTIHELGHQFNLQHTDATSYIEGGIRKFTIMNQTWVMRRHKSTEEEFQVPEGTFSDETQYPGWPKGIGFKFGEFEKIHLSVHPVSNVTPGASSFGECEPVHFQWRQTYQGRIK
jgi:hypothetical protein